MVHSLTALRTLIKNAYGQDLLTIRKVKDNVVEVTFAKDMLILHEHKELYGAQDGKIVYFTLPDEINVHHSYRPYPLTYSALVARFLREGITIENHFTYRDFDPRTVQDIVIGSYSFGQGSYDVVELERPSDFKYLFGHTYKVSKDGDKVRIFILNKRSRVINTQYKERLETMFLFIVASSSDDIAEEWNEQFSMYAEWNDLKQRIEKGEALESILQ